MGDKEIYEGLSKDELLSLKNNPDSRGFTFWDQTQGRPWRTEADNGMRIDYFFVGESLVPRVESVEVLRSIGMLSSPHPSDHAPLLLVLRRLSAAALTQA